MIRSTVFFVSLELRPLGYRVFVLVLIDKSRSFITQLVQPMLAGASDKGETEAVE